MIQTPTYHALYLRQKDGRFFFVRNVHLKGVSLRHGGPLSESMCVGSMQLASLLLSPPVLPPTPPTVSLRRPMGVGRAWTGTVSVWPTPGGDGASQWRVQRYAG